MSIPAAAIDLPADFKADLHTHSYFSDGTYSPRQLVDHALASGCGGLAICDHDAVEAYSAAAEYAQKKGLYLIPGIEISAHLQEESVHILGYSYNPDNNVLKDFCARHRERRAVRNRAILNKLKQCGLALDENEVIDNQAQTITYGRPHIAMAMVKKGYVKDIHEAFGTYLGSGKPCCVEGERWSVDEAIDAIHQAGGLAVLAHPHVIKRERILRELLNKSFDGLEVYYCRFGISQCERFRIHALKNHWLATGGSDFHGDNKPDVTLGVSFVGRETFAHLWAHFKNVT